MSGGSGLLAQGCCANRAPTPVAVAGEDSANLAKAATEDGQTHTSLPTAAAEIDVKSDVVLTAAGPAVMGQGKLQEQQELELPSPFCEPGTKAPSPGLTLESLLLLKSPSWQLHASCLLRANDMQLAVVGPVHRSRPCCVLAIDISTHDCRWLCTGPHLSTTWSSVSTRQPHVPVRGEWCACDRAGHLRMS